jgi:A/G-specific adenine glycosylase
MTSKKSLGGKSRDKKPNLANALGQRKARDFFTKNLLDWGQEFGRKGLPWQCTDAYLIWVSEVMLQQTQVETVKAYFTKFTKRWPTVTMLGQADLDDVLSEWAGLGYYRRAKMLHEAAKIVVDKHGGVMPSKAVELAALPGIGPSTAAAISSLAFGRPEAIMDGNVVRVLTRYFAYSENVGSAVDNKALMSTAKALARSSNPALYTQSIMDLGAMVCTPKNPKCDACPMATSCKGLQSKSPTNFPNKEKKKKLRRVEVAKWDVLFDGTRIALKKNEADKGVWQSMMVFPDTKKELGLTSGEVKSSWSFTHVFSHFDLVVNVRVFSINEVVLSELADRSGWVAEDCSRALKLALPKPVKSCVELIMKQENEVRK